MAGGKKGGKRTGVASKISELTKQFSAVEITARKVEAEENKNMGNEFLKESDLKNAVIYYTKAIELDPTNHVYYSNRSAAHLLNSSAKNSLSDAEICVELKPEWSKGYSRLGAALHFAGRFNDACQAFTQGLEFDPQNSTLLNGLALADAAAIGDGSYVPVESKPVDNTNDLIAPGGEAGSLTKGHVIGIDLGTTFSCVAVWQGDEGVKIIPDEEGNLTTPSVVGFAADGSRTVGHAAKRLATSNPLHTVYDVKRILGSLITDSQVQKDIDHFPFEVIKGAGDKPVIVVEAEGAKKQFHPEEVSAMVLTRMKTIAEKYLGETVHRAVITVPAYFNDAQRQATKDAGAIAGLEVMRIINEPTAAALAYGLDMKGDYTGKESRNILIFDLGGGTFDVSLLSIDGGIFEVKATAGDVHLGGEDFDEAVLKWLSGEFEKANPGVEVTKNPKAMKRIRIAAEQAKRNLSTNDSTSIVVESLINGIDFNVQLTRAQFEKLNHTLFSRCMDTVKHVLKDAKMTYTDIKDIVLVGGSTRIPCIQSELSKLFGGKDLCKSINPDEAVAYGAAVQGAILSGIRPAATQQVLLVDVTALSLGIELEGKVFSTIIPRNSKVPCSRRKTYTTTTDYQDGVDVMIFEGERQCTDGNNLLGEFKITSIERAKRGVPQVEVSFNLDTNGILNVTARDMVTESVAHVTLSNNKSRLSADQIQKMLEDAELHKEEDRLRVENIEAKNELESLLYGVVDSAKTNNQIQVLLDVGDIQTWADSNEERTTEEYVKKTAELRKFM